MKLVQNACLESWTDDDRVRIVYEMTLAAREAQPGVTTPVTNYDIAELLRLDVAFVDQSLARIRP